MSALAPPLDLHEGIVDPSPSRDPRCGGCERWPEGLWLLREATGELVPGRCKSTNLCAYCRRLGVLETVEMWTLDALEWSPTLWAVLTAREHLTRSDCRRHLEQLRRAVRRRWPDAEWAVSVEFQRRGALHLNLLVKGVPTGQAEAFRQVLCDVWCSRVDALPVGQHVEAIADAKGVVAYINKTMAHGLKAEQAPPLGWRGHRTSQTRGYLVRPAAVMRKEAHRSLAIGREVWRGLDLETAASVVDARSSEVWRLAGKAHSDGRSSLRADALRPARLVEAREEHRAAARRVGTGTNLRRSPGRSADRDAAEPAVRTDGRTDERRVCAPVSPGASQSRVAPSPVAHRQVSIPARLTNLSEQRSQGSAGAAGRAQRALDGAGLAPSTHADDGQGGDGRSPTASHPSAV